MGFMDTIRQALAIGDDSGYDDGYENGREDYPEERNDRRSDRYNDPKGDRVIKVSATAQLQVILVKPEVFADTNSTIPQVPLIPVTIVDVRIFIDSSSFNFVLTLKNNCPFFTKSSNFLPFCRRDAFVLSDNFDN